MKKKLIKIEITRKILTITLNDPKNQNTLSENMIKELNDAFIQAAKNNKVKVIILKSTGQIFCAGHNLKDINSKRSDKDKGKKYFKKLIKNCSNLMLNIVKNPKPVIASIDGIATAAGCQLVASCDLAYSSYRSKFATPGVNIGLFCSTPMVALSRNIKNKLAMEMLLTGDLINAKKAYELGLINNYFQSKDLNKNVFKIAEKISSKTSQTLKFGKEAFYKQKEMSLREAYSFASDIMLKNMLDIDSKEGIKAFIEKRNPKWKN